MMNPRSGLTAQILHLLRPYWPIVLGGIVLGAVGGASVAGLLAVVNRGLYATQGDVATLFLAFAGLCLLILIGSIGADISANYVGQRIIAELRKSLAAKILAAPIDQLPSWADAPSSASEPPQTVVAMPIDGSRRMTWEAMSPIGGIQTSNGSAPWGTGRDCGSERVPSTSR